MWLFRIIDKSAEQFNIDGLAIFLSCIYLVIILILIASMFIKTIKKYSSVFILICVMLFLFGAVSFKTKLNTLHNQAVIIAEETEAKFEPFDRATAYFELYEGMQIKIVDSKDEWYKVKRIDNKAGWVRKSDLEIV